MSEKEALEIALKNSRNFIYKRVYRHITRF